MKNRYSNLELLRIISMFFIVMHHYAIHGSAPWANHFHSNIAMTESIYLLFLSIGKAAVVAFVLIGAYFLSEKEFKLWRIVNLCINTFVYSWLIFILLKVCNVKLPALVSGYNLWFPIPIPSNYWFVISYVYMLLLMPFLNLILSHCSKRQILLLLSMLFVFWCILQFLPNNKPDNIDYDFFSTNNYFLFIYLIGGYIRKYYKNGSQARTLIYLIMSLAITFIVGFLIVRYYGIYYDRLWCISAVINDPFGIMIGVSLFLTFKNMKIKTNLVINYISKSMFGVYLIHDNSYIREFLWGKLINTMPLASNSVKYLLYGFTISICVFVVCICIDVIKRLTIDPLILREGQRLTSRVVSWSKKL